MNGTLFLVCVGSFLASAPLLLIVRAIRPTMAPWWLVTALSACLTWILLILADHFSQADFYEQHPMAFADGVEGRAPYWGWLLGLLYLALWLGPYWLFVVRPRRMNRLPNNRWRGP
jgi:hypothetical protein